MILEEIKINKNKITLINIISSLFLQLVNIATYFIIPKLILSYFGSNVNGLVASITQFLGYISLIEGGIGSVIVANLYKPLVENNNERLSKVLKTSQSFYRKIGIIFIGYSIIISIVYPIIFHTGYSYLYVCSLGIILSISLIIQFMFSSTIRNLLNADKKGYIVSLTQSGVLLLTIIISYISVKIYPNIHILKLISGVLFVLQPIIYNKYVNNHYKIKKNIEKDNNLLKQRWNGLAINIASFIHNSTDIALLTIFTNLTTVSIYSVYIIVTNGLRSIIRAVSNAISYTVGNIYAKGNDKELNEKFDLYEFINFNIVFFCFSIAGLLITPFVILYTKNITDANYNQTLFGILLVISEAIYLIQAPHVNLSYTANKFKELTKPAFLEAGINIIVSLVLVNKFGLIGVAIGTICGMSYRVIYQVYFTSKLIKSRKQAKFYTKLIIYLSAMLLGITMSKLLINIEIVDITSWILNAFINTIIFGTIYAIISLLFFKNEVLYLRKYLKRGKKVHE